MVLAGVFVWPNVTAKVQRQVDQEQLDVWQAWMIKLGEEGS